MIDVKDIQARMKSVGDVAYDSTRNVWLLGLGIVSTMERLSRQQFDNLMKQGSATGRVFQKFASRVSERVPGGSRFQSLIEEGPKMGLHRLGIPTQNEINALIERVEQLTQKIEDIKKPA